MAPVTLPWQQEDGRDDEQSQGDDRLSDLPDHILLCILERLRDDVRLLGRTCVLSKRWRTLPPLMLPELDIGFRTFTPADRRRCTRQELCQATDRITGALRFFLSPPTGDDQPPRAIITRLKLRLCLIEANYLHGATQIVGDAITAGVVRDLALVVHTEKGSAFLQESPKNVAVMWLYGRRFMYGLLLAAPAAAAFRSLKVLALQNMWFDGASEVGTLLNTCKALEELTLDCCGFADGSSVLAIDAPHSQLRMLLLEGPYVGRVHLMQAPRLLSLICCGWTSESCPVTFGTGSAPCLKEITLHTRAHTWQHSFSLSELLLENAAANHLHSLCLGFGKGKIWVHPESPKTLGAAFGKLKVLHLMGVFPECDLSWTMFLLQAAPFLEFLNIQVDHNHACPERETDEERELHGVAWEQLPPGFRHRRLRQLRVGGGIGAEKKDVGFARLVMERAVSLELMVLDARVTCEECVAAQRRDPSVVLSGFPDDKDGVDVMVSRIKDGVSICAWIVVYSPSHRLYEYGQGFCSPIETS